MTMPIRCATLASLLGSVSLVFGANAASAAGPRAVMDAPMVVAQVTDEVPEVLDPEQEDDGDDKKKRRRDKAEGQGEPDDGGEKKKRRVDESKQQGEPDDRGASDADKAERDEERGKREVEKLKREEDRAKREAEKQKREDERARAEAEKQKGEDERARAEAEKQKREDDRARADAEKQKGEGERARAEAEKQKRDAEAAKARADQQKREADAAKAAAEKAKQEKDRVQAEPAKPGVVGKTLDRAFGKDGPEDGRDRGDRKEADGAPPKDEKAAREEIRQLKVKTEEEYEKAKAERRKRRDEARGDQREPRDEARERKIEVLEKKFEDLREQRRERVEAGGRIVIEEPGKRKIFREKDRVIIQHDETERFRKGSRDVRVERRPDGTTANIIVRPGGIQIISIEDRDGRLVRRLRRGRDGREVVLIDNRPHRRARPWWRRFGRDRDRRPFFDVTVNLAPPVIRIPRDKYVVDYEDSSEDDVYEALSAPPIERLERGYTLDEVRRSHSLRDRMRRVDLDAINFEFGSWEVENDQYPKLEWVADAIKRVLDRNPDEVFMIEGHTDAVGSDVDNLSLSDRRAESVAVILTDVFNVPPENLVTQGYGEEFLKIDTPYPERQNRRVAVRRITPLLSRRDDRGDDERSDYYDDRDR